MREIAAIAALLLLSGAHEAWGQPRALSYQGRLTTGSGAIVPDGSYSLTFKLYDSASGGTAAWSEAQTVVVTGGLFSVALGSVTPFGFQFNNSYWLGITINGGSELIPRVPLLCAPYSFFSYQAGSVIPPLYLTTGSSHYTTPTLEADASGPGHIAILGVQYGASTPAGMPQSDRNVTKPELPPSGNCGVYGQAWDTLSAGVMAQNMGNGSSAHLAGGDAGVYGYGVFHPGIYGFADGAVDAVYGKNVKNGGHGVFGVADSGTGVWGTSSTGDGLRGESSGANKSGIFAINTNPSGYAGFFTGTVYVNGTLGKAAGAFKIDHPLDPANKYLQHSFVESPDMMDIYNGNVRTDGNGDATITLPNWFEALNRDFRYQLTVIGQFAQAIVASEISNNQFTIKTDKPSVKVSWQVTGIRHDAYAEAHRIQVEVDKTGPERGKYLSPKEHGVSETLGMYYETALSRKPETKLSEQQK